VQAHEAEVEAKRKQAEKDAPKQAKRDKVLAAKDEQLRALADERVALDEKERRLTADRVQLARSPL
jgi:hypothetical protein